MKIESLDHIHIYSQNPEESAAFYTEHFEAVEVFRSQNIHDQTRIFLAVGGLILVIGPFPPDIAPADPPSPGDGAYPHGYGVAHFGFKVPDIEEAARELRQRGIQITTEPTHEPGGLSYCYLAAPDGVISSNSPPTEVRDRTRTLPLFCPCDTIFPSPGNEIFPAARTPKSNNAANRWPNPQHQTPAQTGKYSSPPPCAAELFLSRT